MNCNHIICLSPQGDLICPDCGKEFKGQEISAVLQDIFPGSDIGQVVNILVGAKNKLDSKTHSEKMAILGKVLEYKYEP